MTRFLLWFLGRMPIGWLQLASNKLRFSAAGIGVAFACILVFVQLGMMGSFRKATAVPYQILAGDIMISASDANGLADGSHVARRRMFQALGVPGTQEAAPVFVGKVIWLQPNGSKIELTAIGIDPARKSFIGPAVNQSEVLQLVNTALLDRRSRGLNAQQLEGLTPENPLLIEASGTQISVAGTISLGGGFGGDGFLVVSDQTFLQLFPNRFTGAPNHILLNVEPGADPAEVSVRIQNSLGAEALRIRPFVKAIEEEVVYQTTRRPVGLIFGFGVAIGTLVGLVIVYQILSTDVADHLSEYATFKAMGYEQKFFRSIIIEEAVILALTGFFPALLAAMGIYSVMAKATGLPIAMTVERAVMVLIGTVLSCAVSGFLAMRKLANADPADLF